LIVVLAAVAAIPLGALWGAFGPYAHRAPDFTLTDQAGRPFTLSAQAGHPVVIFFGYTHCPDECPITLARLSQALHAPDVPPGTEVVLITVDPARDSPAVLGRYVRAFDASIVGLTGTPQALESVYAAYHTWHQRTPPESGEHGYSVAHGTTIYYLGRGGSLKGFGNWDDSTATIVRALHDLS
jgi:protein SCO1/2